MANGTTHRELISTLYELYTLLSSLGAVPAVYLPDPKTGTHPDGAINTASATAAGYAPGTVQLMTALPYLTDASHEMFVQLLPSTYPITYLGETFDEGYFLGFRELLNDAEMLPTALQLTRSEIYGTVFIYDTATSESFSCHGNCFILFYIFIFFYIFFTRLPSLTLEFLPRTSNALETLRQPGGRGRILPRGQCVAPRGLVAYHRRLSQTQILGYPAGRRLLRCFVRQLGRRAA